MDYGLLWGIAACYFGLLGFPCTFFLRFDDLIEGSKSLNRGLLGVQVGLIIFLGREAQNV